MHDFSIEWRNENQKIYNILWVFRKKFILFLVFERPKKKKKNTKYKYNFYISSTFPKLMSN